jgi:hypothetical protein
MDGNTVMSKNGIYIGNRRIGAGSPCFVIAEAGINHNGDHCHGCAFGFWNLRAFVEKHTPKTLFA